MYYGPPQFTKLLKNEKTGMTSFSSTISMICEDKIRMELVIQCVEKCMKENLYTFVFADRREYLEEIRRLLHEKNHIGKNNKSITNNNIQNVL